MSEDLLKEDNKGCINLKYAHQICAYQIFMELILHLMRIYQIDGNESLIVKVD